MNSIIKNIFIVVFSLVTVSLFSQNTTQELPENDIEKGVIRLKIKEKYLLNNIAAKGINVSKSKTKVLGISAIDNVGDKVGITRIKRVFPFSIKNEAKHRKYGLHQWYELEFDENINPNSVVEQYSTLAEVELAKPVYKKINIDQSGDPIKIEVSKLSAVDGSKPTIGNKTSGTNGKEADFNDPMLADQWHYYNDGSNGTQGMDIDLLKAWTIATGSKDIIVAVVDGGIDVEHEDLKENIWINEAELNGEKGVDDDQNGYVDDINGANFSIEGPLTKHYHGTHVAGTVGAVTNNGIGVAGVAGGDGSGNGVLLMSCQVFDDRAAESGNFAAAIVYGADNGAVISQNSWGYSQPTYYEPEVLDAVRYFKAEAGQYEGSPMKGGVLFFAAGNDGLEQTHYPGAFEEVIAVTALGPTGFPAGYSNSGEWTDIAAPGGDQSFFGEEGGVLSTFPDNQYGYFQGTSMATPHASGVAALVISKFGGDNFTGDELDFIMRNSTTGFVFDHQDKYGSGMLNATRALADDEKIAPDAIKDLKANEIFHNSVTLGWTVPVDEDNFEPAYFYLAVSTEEITAENFDRQTIYAFANPFDAGTAVNVTLGGLNKQTNYWYAIKSVDLFQNVSNISNILGITTTDEPHFSTSRRSIDVTIDVNNNPIHKENITFSNIGEGNILWENYVLNERYYFEVQEKIAGKLAQKIKVSSLQEDTTNNTTIGFKPLSAKQSNQIETKPSFWDNDETVAVAGISYQDGSPAVSVLGARKNNSGLVHGTRFFVQPTFSFNLTHVEVGLLPQVNDKPIIIEIKSGSTDIHNAKTVHLQEYYPDTIGVFKYYRIPLHKPQYFEDGETFWIVMHHPEEDVYPLGVFIGPRYYNHFMMSDDNGQTFYDYQPTYPARFYAPVISALSSGDDGSYVFLDPGSGKIPSGEEENVTVNIDANTLTEGKHLASLTITTNDVHLPYVNIEVKVNVVGQQPEINRDIVNKFEVIQNSTTDLKFDFENIGLAKLQIYSLEAVHEGITTIVTDTITIFPTYAKEVPFTFQASDVGTEDFSVTLKTNIGDLLVPVSMHVKESGKIGLSVDNSTITINHDEEKTVALSIKNEGTSSFVEYNLEYNKYLKAGKNIIAQDQEYTIVTSDDPVGPVADQWDDISLYGREIIDSFIWGDTLKTTMKFPMYNETFQKSWANRNGVIYFRQQPDGALQMPNRSYGLSYVAPLLFKDYKGQLEHLYFYDFGDRAVYSFEITSNRYATEDVEGNFRYQIVLFRNGTVEYRYKNVDNITDTMNYVVTMQSANKPIHTTYKNLDDTEHTVHNGMVIRFEPKYDVSMITDVSVPEGLVGPGETDNLELTLDPKNFELVEGIYENFINVETNTENGLEAFPLTIEVKGTPNFTSIDSLIFERNAEGSIRIKYAEISNDGYGNGDITTISFSGANYSVSEQFPMNIKPRSKVVIPVSFKPTTSGVLNEKMTINFSNGFTKVIELIGEARINVEYAINIPETIDVNINAGEVVEIPFEITNLVDNADFEYSFLNGTYAKAGIDDTRRGEEKNLDAFKDTYGYTWNVSDSTRAFYKWEEIKETGTVHKIGFDDQLGIKLNFSFPFYGETHDSIWVSKNGYLTVNKPTEDLTYVGFEKEDGMSGMIAPFWSSIIPPYDSGVLVLHEEDRIVIQWNEYKGEDVNASGGLVTFQVEIHENGAINFNYKNISAWGGYLRYGLESPDETETLEEKGAYILSWTRLKDSTTVAIAPPLNGQVLKSNTKNFKLELSAQNIFRSGIYKDTVVLASNSGSSPIFKIPVTLRVNGNGKLSGPDSLTWDEEIFNDLDGTFLTKEITLKNEGYEVLSISNFSIKDLDDLKLYDASGELVAKNSSGDIIKIDIEPWGELKLTVEIPVEEFNNVNGEITISGDFDTLTIPVTATIVTSPIFDWDAVNQNFTLNNNEIANYTFTIENKGETTLKYDLIPAVIPNIEGGQKDAVIVKEVGNIVFEKPAIIKQLANDFKEEGDGVFTPFVSGAQLAFSSRYVAPVGGFYMTHIEMFTYLGKINEHVKVMVYIGGDKPNEGEKVYEEDFVVVKKVDAKWINFPLKVPVSIPEGETFHVMYVPPVDVKYCGFDLSNDVNLLENSQAGVRNETVTTGYRWFTMVEEEMNTVWKIRPTTAAGESLWLTLDHLSGEVISGESKSVTASVDSKLTGPGEHFGKVLAVTNDINRTNDEFEVIVNVNGAPVFDFAPNKYADTLFVTELNDLVVNYNVSDPENDDLTFEFKHLENEPEVTFTQIDNNIAQVKISTDYESSGLYNWEVSVADGVGNISIDTLVVKVLDKNRAPILNEEYAILEFNIADPNQVLVIDPSDLFTDPDGDELQILAGNYTPDIVDLALGSTYIDVHPLQEGTGFIVFGADDGKEDGFVIYGIYVIIINDPSAVTASPDGFPMGVEIDDLLLGDIVVSPNPVTEGVANVFFNLDSGAKVTFGISDMNGRMVYLQTKNYGEKGLIQENINVPTLSPGVYILQLIKDGKTMATKKILVN